MCVQKFSSDVPSNTSQHLLKSVVGFGNALSNDRYTIKYFNYFNQSFSVFRLKLSVPTVQLHLLDFHYFYSNQHLIAIDWWMLRRRNIINAPLGVVLFNSEVLKTIFGSPTFLVVCHTFSVVDKCFFNFLLNLAWNSFDWTHTNIRYTINRVHKFNSI